MIRLTDLRSEVVMLCKRIHAQLAGPTPRKVRRELADIVNELEAVLQSTAVPPTRLNAERAEALLELVDSGQIDPDACDVVTTVAVQLRDGFDLVAHLHRQRAFSTSTFGPGLRTEGVIAHLRKELKEIERAPFDLEEWADVLLLAFDGAWRHGHSPEAIAQMIAAKQAKNESRQWPDWRTAAPDQAIEHVRGAQG